MACNQQHQLSQGAVALQCANQHNKLLMCLLLMSGLWFMTVQSTVVGKGLRPDRTGLKRCSTNDRTPVHLFQCTFCSCPCPKHACVCAGLHILVMQHQQLNPDVVSSQLCSTPQGHLARYVSCWFSDDFSLTTDVYDQVSDNPGTPAQPG